MKEDKEKCWTNFKLEIVLAHRSSFGRRLHEAVTIMLQEGEILNNVNEYNPCIIPSLGVKGGRPETNTQGQARKERDLEATVRERELDINLHETIKKRRETSHESRVARKRPRQETAPVTPQASMIDRQREPSGPQ